MLRGLFWRKLMFHSLFITVLVYTTSVLIIFETLCNAKSNKNEDKSPRNIWNSENILSWHFQKTTPTKTKIFFLLMFLSKNFFMIFSLFIHLWKLCICTELPTDKNFYYFCGNVQKIIWKYHIYIHYPDKSKFHSLFYFFTE